LLFGFSDVTKTKIQTNPAKYPGIASAIATVWKEEGPSTLFTGWLPTVLGNFVGGGVLYALTEFIRRSLSEAAGVEAVSLEVPIILIAAAVSSAAGAIIICPFEAVRIRTVAQPEYAENSVGVLERMLKEEGIGSLVNAIPVFLVRNIPYAMVKFLIFDLSTEWAYETYPAAQESLQLSLLVSLIGGIMGGSAAALISNPADAVISELKKAKTDISPFEAVNNMLERAGPSAFFVGLPLRMVFYSLIASLTFVIYDAVRFALGIGADDLKLYLDVLGGALNDNRLV
jgi:solute carrier family 25 (mitochondrial phosphate transporter), member 3